ncbi:MAG: redoxin domain-containing protein [Planctomycetaceae bacterium]|nr:redoxin domain-containing protein [Planctomycetaceae bacterium]
MREFCQSVLMSPAIVALNMAFAVWIVSMCLWLVASACRRLSPAFRHTLLCGGLLILAAIPLAMNRSPVLNRYVWEVTVAEGIEVIEADEGTEGFSNGIIAEVPVDAEFGPVRYGESRSATVALPETSSSHVQSARSSSQMTLQPEQRVSSHQARASVKSQHSTLPSQIETERPLLRSSARSYWPVLLLLTWALGAVIAVLRLAKGCWLVFRMALQPFDEPELMQLVSAATRAAGLKRAPQLVTSPYVTVPFSMGWIRPMIGLPSDIHRWLCEVEIQDILTHECAHIARHDHWIAVGQRLLTCVYWWNPVLHVMNRLLDDSREQLCDDLVLVHGLDPRRYARTLVCFAERVARPRVAMRPGVLTLFGERTCGLEGRIRRLLDPQTPCSLRTSYPGRLVVGGLMLLLFFSVTPLSIRFVSADAPTVPPPSPSGDKQNNDGELIADIDEKIALLKKIAAASKANYERLHTWTGSGTYVASQLWDVGPEPHTQRAVRHADIKFALDVENDALMVRWNENEPVRLVNSDTGETQLLTQNVNQFHSILQGDQWLDLRTTSRFETDAVPLFKFDRSQMPRVLVEHEPGDTKQSWREGEGLIDPRVWTMLHGRQTFSGRGDYAWEDFPAQIKYYEEHRLDPERKDNCVILRQLTDVGEVLKVRYCYSKGGKPSWNDRDALRIERTFEEKHAYSVTRKEMWEGQSRHEVALITYRSSDGVSTPVGFSRSILGLVPGCRTESVEIQLTESEINQELDPAMFSEESLGLQDGDHITDSEQHMRLVLKNGERVPPEDDNPRSSSDWYPQASTSLLAMTFGGNEWTDLVHKKIELFNRWLRAKPDELSAGERQLLYRENREANEELAKRYVALHPMLEGAHRENLGMNCLCEAVLNEYAGPAADEAAEMLIQEGFEAHGAQSFAMQLGFSLPASLAAEQVLRAMIEQTEDEAVEAQARSSLAQFLATQAQRVRMIDALPGRGEKVALEYGDWYLNRLLSFDPDAMELEAEELWRSVIDEYPHVMCGNEKVTLRASMGLARLRHAIGRRAPDIIGEDFDRQTFQLSESDGKVRVLMFWGQWCGPCRRHYPLLRELMATHADAPFEILGICSDEKKEAIDGSVKDGTVSWRFWWDGGEDRWRIHNEWGLYGSPWFFVLDADGIIRFTDVRGDELKLAVQSLLIEQQLEAIP